MNVSAPLLPFAQDERLLPDYFLPACRRLLRDGYELLPVAMDPSDLPALGTLVKTLGIQEETLLPQTTGAFLALARSCRACLATRLHVAVLAACVGVPTALVAYRDKAQDFLLTMGAENLGLSMTSDLGDRLQGVAWQVVQDADELGFHLWKRAQYWSAQLLAALDELLVRGGLSC